MHIVFVTAFFVESEKKPTAGMPRYIYKIARFLSERGHRVEIVAGAGYSKEWKYKGITVYNCATPQDIEGSSIEVSANILQREIVLQRKLRELDRINMIDIVQYAGWSGVGCLHSLKCPGILRISTYSRIQYEKSEIFKKVECYSFWERMAGLHADGILSPSSVLGNQFGRDIHKKVVLMETPYDNAVVEDESLYRKILASKEYFLFYGQTSIDKGFAVIQDMMPELLAAYENLYFVVAGWNSPQDGKNAIGILRRKLGEYAERFIYLGPISQSMLFPVIRHAKCVLIPSLIDNLPNSCLEALYLGQIVIGTCGTSLEQLIENRRNGYLVKPGSSEELLGAAKEVCGLSDEQRSLMAKKSKKMLECYHPTYAVKKLEKYYEWVIAHKRR